MKQKKRIGENLFDAADKFVAAFFKGLEQNTANQIIKKAEKAKLPADVIQRMEDINKRVEDFRDSVKHL